MKTEYQRYWIDIIPESEIERTYLETVLELSEPNSEGVAVRQNSPGMGELVSVRIIRGHEPAKPSQ